MGTLTIHLGERSYPIHVAPGILDRAGALMVEALGPCRCAMITDDQVGPLYLRRLEESLQGAGLSCAALTLPAGEPTKSLASLGQVYDFLCQAGLTRRDALIALGGGVMGDLAGLAAATFLRGVAFVQVPTSLLAQVDSSVGGKVAVDLPQGKNLVGAFYQPRLVILIRHPAHPQRSGLAGRPGGGGQVRLHRGRGPLYSSWRTAPPGAGGPSLEHMDAILHHCLRAKAAVVEQDEHDTGLRMILNFGHTLGHAVETVQGYGGLRHGEAVALGMAVITRMSEDRGLTQVGTSARLTPCWKPWACPPMWSA